MLSVHQFIPKTFACAVSLLMASALSTKSETMPLPRERPSVLEDHTQKWNLERGKSYAVRVAAGPRSVEAKALAESETVRIALTDRFLLRSLRTADALEVHGEGATRRVPLDGSTVALARLDACSDRNNRAGTETNPFVSPSNRPRHRMPRSPWWGVSFFR